nr:hypothetical protein [Tanacetum cinerariifolium]
RVTDSRVSTNSPLPSSSSPSHSFDIQQIVASLEDKLDIRMNRFEKSLNDMKAFVTPTAPIKAAEEVCVTFQSLNKVDFIDAGESEFYSEETEKFLNNDLIPIGIENFVFDQEEDILYLESLLSEEPFPLPPMNPNQAKSSIKEPGTHYYGEERIRREHAEYISRMEMLFIINPRPRPMVNANMIIESFPSSLIPVQDNDSQWEEIDVVTNTDELLPPGFENDDSEGEIDVVDELHVDNSISNFENKLSNNEESEFDSPSFLRPPLEPPDAEFDFKPDAGEEILVVMNDSDKFESLDPRDEFDVSNNENDDYFSFMFVIRIFLLYLICFKMFSFLLFAESEDTIFYPGISI